MKKKDRHNLVAPCGIDCGICELYVCKNDEALFNTLVNKGVPASKIPCNGCRSMNGNCPVMPEVCETFNCVSDKKISFCYDCSDFPCNKLHPAADRANILPHNLKLYNLCTIKRMGLEKFIDVSSSHKKSYYTGKMVLGRGPQIET